jgi:hypothetical protein
MRAIPVIALVVLAVGCVRVQDQPTCRQPSPAPQTAPAPPPAPPDARALAVWKEFVAEIRRGEWPEQRFRLYPGLEGMVDQNRKWLREFRDDPARLKQFDVVPRAYRVASHIHFLLPWVYSNGERAEYLFTVLDEGGSWYFRVMEMLQLPIYAIPPLPARSFPKLGKSSLDWRRAEGLTSKDINLWTVIKKEKGAEAAFRWFADGGGYLMQVQTWLPYFPTHTAFVLYLCWEQTDLWGNQAVLRELDDRRAVVEFPDAVHFALYERALHLRHKISRDDYRTLFETIWRARAERAGWKVGFRYGAKPELVELRFTRD